MIFMGVYISAFVAIILSIGLFRLVGHLQWPKWKAYSKNIVYIILSVVGTYFWGNWFFIYVLGHPLLGLTIHVYWCKKHDLNWINANADKYIQSQKDYFKMLKELKEKREK